MSLYYLRGGLALLVAALPMLPAFAAKLEAADLAVAAQERTQHAVIYDGSYQKIPYPGGDVANNRGVCTDVLIRSYRRFGIDLQRLVHEDMLENFAHYPQRWGLKRADSNIDHRRVPNLETFFTRHGTALVKSDQPGDYHPGDIVSWRLSNGLPHIGVVSSHRSADGSRPLIVHNIGSGPKEEDVLFAYDIAGHFRFLPEVSH